MLVKLMEQLESVPEGNGTMMDNTNVYTSNNADKQHTNGSNWSGVLLGDCGGASRQVVSLVGRQGPINGVVQLHFTVGVGLTDSICRKPWPKSMTPAGPLQEILS